MKKQVLSSFIVLSLILAPSIKAEVPTAIEPISEQTSGSSLDDSTPLAVDPVAEDLPEEQGTPVGKASDKAKNNAKKKQWQNIAIAVCAVAVAVTALILVSSNEGHKSKS